MTTEDELELAESMGGGAEASAGAEVEVSPPKRRWRPQIGEWYVTLAMVGALVGLFVAGLLVALNQAFPEGSSGGMNAGLLTGVSIAIIAAASALGALMAGVPPLIKWTWRRVRGKKAASAMDSVSSAMEMQHGYVDVDTMR